MSLFKKHKEKVIVTIVTIILLITIGITANDRKEITSLENTIGKVVTPVQSFFYKIGDSISDRFSSIGNYINAKDKNEELKKQVKILEKENRDMEDIIARKDFLKSEMKLKNDTDFDIIEVKIVSRDPENWLNKFIINKGSNDDIKKDDVVIQATKTNNNLIREGLVGIVIEVGDTWSKVLPITDTDSNVSYKTIRTQDFGVATGTIDNKMEGFLFDIEANVKKGDQLITSGMGEVFISDIYIGEITEVKIKKEKLEKEIKIKPAVDFKKINDLFVINTKKVN